MTDLQINTQWLGRYLRRRRVAARNGSDGEGDNSRALESTDIRII
jgi:hypothetical protein